MTRRRTIALGVIGSLVAVALGSALVSALPVAPGEVAQWVTGRAITVDVPTSTYSDTPTQLTVSVGRSLAQSGLVRVVRLGGTEETVATAALEHGKAVLEVSPWKTDSFLVIAETPTGTVTREVTIPTLPTGTVVPSASDMDTPRPLPDATDVYPNGDRPSGPSADATIEPIPDALWKTMKGRSWQPNCPVSRNDLRLVTVNHFGFDGYRYRGHMVVNRTIARDVAQALTRLHDSGYPIRQIRLPEEFPLDSVRGVSDYEMMEADNTSGFNCRYVVGRESERALSPHAYGLAVDVNPLENPFKSRAGIVPYPQWVKAPSDHPAVIRTAKNPAVKAFIANGATWGGTFGAFDYHHFEWRRQAS